jgi:hypothetical protein
MQDASLHANYSKIFKDILLQIYVSSMKPLIFATNENYYKYE